MYYFFLVRFAPEIGSFVLSIRRTEKANEFHYYACDICLCFIIVSEITVECDLLING